MKTSRPMTKPPLVVARMALSLARESIPAYSAKFSPRCYTQHQLFALMALREFLKLDYPASPPIITGKRSVSTASYCPTSSISIAFGLSGTSRST